MRSPDAHVNIFTSLMDNKTLKELDLARTSSRFKVPPEFFASNTKLTHLNLSFSLCEDPSILASFFEALTVNSTLTSLKLVYFEIVDSNGNRRKIGDSECKLISDTLKVNTALTDLNLRSNCIGNDGIQCIMEALRVNTTLKYLDLSGQRLSNRVVPYPPSLKKVNTSVCVSW